MPTIMPNITEQLVTLALQTNWDNTPSEAATALQQVLASDEQALLKEKIICFILTPEPKEPEETEEPKQPEPEEPEPEIDVQNDENRQAG